MSLPITTEPDPVSKKKYIVQWFPMTVVRHEISIENEYFDKFAELLRPVLTRPAVTKPVAYKPYTPFNTYENIKPYESTKPSESFGLEHKVKDEYPKIPFPEVKTLTKEEDIDEWEDIQHEREEIEYWAEMLTINKDSFDKWMLKLLAGTPLKCLTEHLSWSSATGERLMASWRESVPADEFERFMTGWIPDCTAFTSDTLESFFESNGPINLDYDVLEKVFCKHLLDTLTSELEYDEYVEILISNIALEFDYPYEGK